MLKSSELLLNIRLCFYTVAFIHLAIVACIVLSIDMSKDADPKVSVYITIRWRLITCWFNLITLAYFPMCLYCDWMEKQGHGECPRVTTVRKVKDLVMTSILFPTIMYADTIFWRLWHKDPELIAPARIFAYLPIWSQHSLHTLSMVVIILDLILVPRRRPASVLPNFALMTTFFSTYCSVLVWSYSNGKAVYALFDTFETHKLIILLVHSYIEYLFYFTTQWCIIDYIWSRPKSYSLESSASRKVR